MGYQRDNLKTETGGGGREGGGTREREWFHAYLQTHASCIDTPHLYFV